MHPKGTLNDIANGIKYEAKEKGVSYVGGYILGEAAQGAAMAGAGSTVKAAKAGKVTKNKKFYATDSAKKVDIIVESVSTKSLNPSDAEKMAFEAIHGSKNADKVVLGKYDSGSHSAYTNVAKDMDAQFFQLDNWNELAYIYSDDEIWKINEKFLDIQISSGREIYLSHNPAEYIMRSDFYSRELNYLIENGYTFVKEGRIWHAIR